MAFRKFLSSLGINAPEVETVLDRTVVRPGESLTANITVRGGGADVEIERFAVELVVRFESHGETEARYLNPIFTYTFDAPFVLRAGETRTEKVALELPWEMPLTHALGRPLTGAYSAVRTLLAIDGAVDRGDVDPVEVHALPAQDAVLRALEELGFRRVEAEVKPGHAHGTRQSADWWQEIEHRFPAAYGLKDVELLLVARESDLDVHPGTSAKRLTLPYEETTDHAVLTTRLDRYLREQFGVR
ncbi:sporulation protein [Streptomyces phyllanthi]|uniref:Sporulation protein n=1 Tax=Streptomyces phyllanthi TaxID=1803180 RepID=A0A5N8W682_9ACTN|nr:sporulation protein [Streptomyces phyllanthi]MPY42990.1 sporulation protein [Streptomyces phyllanthi]